MSKLEHGSRGLAKIHAVANDRKYFSHLTGFLEGVSASGYLEHGEFTPLLVECREFVERLGDPDANDILLDFEAELLDFETIAACAAARSDMIDPTCEKSALNRFLGFCRGISCDGIITAKEASAIVNWLELDGRPFDVPGVREIYTTAYDAIQDGVVDRAEASEIADAIRSVVGESYSDTGLSGAFAVAAIEEYRFEKVLEELRGSVVVLTGTFGTSPRTLIEEELFGHGAVIANAVTGKTKFLLIGGEASRDWVEMNRGTKLRKAQELRQLSPYPKLVSESQLL